MVKHLNKILKPKGLNRHCSFTCFGGFFYALLKKGAVKLKLCLIQQSGKAMFATKLVNVQI